MTSAERIARADMDDTQISAMAIGRTVKSVTTGSQGYGPRQHTVWLTLEFGDGTKLEIESVSFGNDDHQIDIQFKEADS